CRAGCGGRVCGAVRRGARQVPWAAKLVPGEIRLASFLLLMARWSCRVRHGLARDRGYALKRTGSRHHDFVRDECGERELEAVETGHRHVGEDEIRPFAARLLERIKSVFRFEHEQAFGFRD